MKEEELKKDEMPENKGVNPTSILPEEGKNEPDKAGEGGEGDDDDDKPIAGGGSNGLPIKK